MLDSITLFHGGKRLNQPIEVRAPKSGRYECGPGFYSTTKWITAAKYARGGGRIHLVTYSDALIEPSRWLEHARIPLEAMMDFLKSISRLPQRQDIYARLVAATDQYKTNTLPAYILLNLMVNAEACGGHNGVALAEFLAANNIAASLHSKCVGEQWVITFDPKVIEDIRPIPSNEVASLSIFDLAPVENQIKAITDKRQNTLEHPHREE